MVLTSKDGYFFIDFTALFSEKDLYFLGEWNTIKKQGDNTECADSSTG